MTDWPDWNLVAAIIFGSLHALLSLGGSSTSL